MRQKHLILLLMYSQIKREPLKKHLIFMYYLMLSALDEDGREKMSIICTQKHYFEVFISNVSISYYCI